MNLATRFSLLLIAAVTANLSVADDVDYGRDIAPIMNKFCVGCHNGAEAESDVRLDSRANFPVQIDGNVFVKAGDEMGSHLMALLRGTADPKMPPDDEPQPSAKDIELIARWIREGAQAGKSDGMRPTFANVASAAGSELEVNAIAMDSTGKRLALARFGRVEIVDSKSGESLRVIEGLPGKVNAVHFADDNKRILVASGIAGAFGQASLWRTDSEETPISWEVPGDTFYAIDMTADGKRIAAAGYDKIVRIWDVDSRKLIHELSGHNGAIYSLSFDPSGEVLATASADETVKLWNVESGKRLDTLGQPLAEQYCVSFVPDGKHVVAAGADNRIRVWRLASKTAQLVNPMMISRFAHDRPIVALSMSAGGEFLCSAAEDGTVKLWNASDLRLLHQFPLLPGTPVGLAVSPDASVLHTATLQGKRDRFPVPPRSKDARKVEGDLAVIPRAVRVPPVEMSSVREVEPNDDPGHAQTLQWPVVVEGVIDEGDERTTNVDCFRISVSAGERVILEVSAARDKSPLDSKIEVLDALGKPITRVQLQAVRDSYFTFRGKDSRQVGDFRIHNWQEMELNEFFYSSGEVTKLWLYPRGPDSGFTVYPGFGNRYTYFGTTGVSHALGEPGYVVRPLPAGDEPLPNGLPVFQVFYENDDDPLRRWGTDSRLDFTAPADGDYIVRVRDSRGFGGSDHKYKLTLRSPKPDFRVSITSKDLKVRRGSGAEFVVRATRLDGFDGPIDVQLRGLPEGFVATHPLRIQEGHTDAVGTITAMNSTVDPAADSEPISIVASAKIGDEIVERSAGNLGKIQLDDKEAVIVHLMPQGEKLKAIDWVQGSDAKGRAANKPYELTIKPGQTISARLVVERGEFKGVVTFGKEDSGRNLPHGVYVDNIGLNGLMVPSGQTEREFFITAAPWVPETDRLFHLKARVGGNPTTWPVLLKVRSSAE